MTIGFELEWYNRSGDDIIVGNAELPLTTEDEMRSVFGAESGGEFGDWFKVSEQHLEWLRSQTSVPIDLTRYEYFVQKFAQ